METHLTIKHLAGYLPYNAKILDFVNGGNCIINDTYVLEPKNCHRCLTFAKETEKLILRPLSDLTKEDWNSVFVNSDIDNILSIYQSDKHLGCVEYYLVNLLLSHHFDVFGLIKKGLAIDINTLK